MKKILLMTFVSVALLATVSCSKDDDKTDSLVGTEWECSESLTVMGFNASFTAQLSFISETMCNFSGSIDAGALFSQELPARETKYSFDGKKVRFKVEELSTLLGTDELVLTYNDELRTMTYELPAQVAGTIGISSLVFHRTK